MQSELSIQLVLLFSCTWALCPSLYWCQLKKRHETNVYMHIYTLDHFWKFWICLVLFVIFGIFWTCASHRRELPHPRWAPTWSQEFASAFLFFRIFPMAYGSTFCSVTKGFFYVTKSPLWRSAPPTGPLHHSSEPQAQRWREACVGHKSSADSFISRLHLKNCKTRMANCRHHTSSHPKYQANCTARSHFPCFFITIPQLHQLTWLFRNWWTGDPKMSEAERYESTALRCLQIWHQDKWPFSHPESKLLSLKMGCASKTEPILQVFDKLGPTPSKPSSSCTCSLKSENRPWTILKTVFKEKKADLT